MIKSRTLSSTFVLRWKYSPVALYAAVFLYAFSLATILIALPWLVIAFEGGSFAVGSVGGLVFGTYIISCLLFGPHADRLGTKRLVMLAMVSACVIFAGMALAPSIAISLLLAGALGLISGMFWAPLMGWLSAGNEGRRLNRRLSMFNFSWALGNIVGYWFGGNLIAVSVWLPFVTASCCAFLAFVLVAGVRRKRTEVPDSTVPPGDFAHPPELRTFRRMSRVALLTAWISMGAMSTPLASLIDDMSLGPDAHAPVAAGISIMLMCSFFLLGRTPCWHYRISFLLLMQLLSAGMLACIALSGGAGELALFALAATPGFAVAYSSDLYYGVSGGTRRAASMAIHEILVASGATIGSLGSGALGGLIGVREVYYVIGACMAVSVAVQAGIFIRSRISRAK